MIKILIITLLFALVLSASARIVTFQTSAVATTNAVYTPRNVVGRLTNGLIIGGLFTATKKTSPGTSDGIRAAAYVYPGIGPTSVMSYFARNTSITEGANQWDFSVSTASNFLGTRFHSIQEVNPSGTVVRTEYLALYVWAVTDFSQAGASVHYVTLTGQRLLGINTLVVELTFMVPESLVNVTLNSLAGGTLVSPTGVETLIGIDASKYTYASTSNNLNLVAYVATGSVNINRNRNSTVNAAGGSAGVNNFVTSGSGSSQIVFRSAATISANGNTSPVTVTFTANTDFSVFNGSDLQTQVQAKYSGSATLTAVNIPFPAGATTIIYDPTITAGVDPACTSSSSLVVFSFALLFILSVISFVF
jgi:hypothetical protein